MASDTVLACDSSSNTRSRPVTQVQVPVGDGGPRKHAWNGRGPFSISGSRPGRLESRPGDDLPVAQSRWTRWRQRTSMSPLFLRYMSQYTYCISMYRYVLPVIGTMVFFQSTKMYVLAGIRTYLVIYARICLASFGLPDFGAVRPTALRAYRKLSCWPAAY